MAEWINHTKQYLQQLPANGTCVTSQFDFIVTHMLTPLKALHSFRIVQEALTNALKHAKAKNIIVKGNINTQNKYELSIEDDGRGFQPELTKKGYGLKNISKRMNELGGTLDIDSKPGIGTTIKVTWPI
jgi:signal transduction histidine kinase